MPLPTKVIEAPLRLLGDYQVDCVIVGGVAAAIHGSSLLTADLDICYARDAANLLRLAEALQSVNARLRNAPAGLPFILDAETLKRGLNFTFTTDIGDLDLLGEVRGIGHYEAVIVDAVMVDLFGYRFAVMNIGRLIAAKRATGRPKDLLALPELEAIQEAQVRMIGAESEPEQS
jgi:hypothetical protein